MLKNKQLQKVAAIDYLSFIIRQYNVFLMEKMGISFSIMKRLQANLRP